MNDLAWAIIACGLTAAATICLDYVFVSYDYARFARREKALVINLDASEREFAGLQEDYDLLYANSGNLLDAFERQKAQLRKAQDELAVMHRQRDALLRAIDKLKRKRGWNL